MLAGPRMSPAVLRRAFAAGALAAATACGGAQGPAALPPGGEAELAYEKALRDLEDGKCLDAQPRFQEVRRQYPFSRFAALAELGIADCLLKEDKPLEAIQAYRQFVRTRPSHPRIPYARFQIAYAYHTQIPDEWLLSPPAYERDQTPTREALRQLRRFILDFPDDEHTSRARELAEQALLLLARHELYVARFYLGRDNTAAAVARLRTLLRTYQGSGIEPEALLLLGHTHLKARAPEDARVSFEDLIERFPDTVEAAKARAFLEELGPRRGPVDVGGSP